MAATAAVLCFDLSQRSTTVLDLIQAWNAFESNFVTILLAATTAFCEISDGAHFCNALNSATPSLKRLDLACHLFLQPLCAFRSQHKEASRMKQCADSAIAMFCSCRWHFRPSSSHIVLYRPQQPRLNFTVQQGFCRGGTSHIHAVTITLFTCFTSSFGMEQTWVDEEKTLSL